MTTNVTSKNNMPTDAYKTLAQLVRQHNTLLKAANSEIDSIGSRYANEMRPLLQQIIDEVIAFTDLKIGPIEIDVTEIGTTKEGLKVVGATHITKQGVQKDVHLIDDKGIPRTMDTETIGVSDFVARMDHLEMVAAITDKVFDYLGSVFQAEPERGPYA